MRDSRRNVRSGLLAFLMVLLVASTTMAYGGQVRLSLTVTADAAVVPCYLDVNLTATVLNTVTLAPVEGKTVKWEIISSESRHDSLSDDRTTTNAAGKATVTLSFGYKPGARVVKATVDGIRVTTTVRCTVGWWWDHWH